VTWKQQLFNKAFTLMQDPRVAKLLQDPRVMSSIMGAMKLRTDVERSLRQRIKQLTKSLRLASEDEVQELQRAVARLEQELERSRGGGQSRRETPDRSIR
jgi:hypothetical protein